MWLTPKGARRKPSTYASYYSLGERRDRDMAYLDGGRIWRPTQFRKVDAAMLDGVWDGMYRAIQGVENKKDDGGWSDTDVDQVRET